VAGRSRKKEEEPTRDEVLDALEKDLKKRYPGRVFRGEEYTMPWALKRLPTGIIDLDIALNGGLPAGGLTMLVGKPSVGKNFVINKVFAQQQRLYGDECAIAVIGLEFPYDKGQANFNGVRVPLSDAEIAVEDKKSWQLYGHGLTDEQQELFRSKIGRFWVVPPSTAEENFDVAVDLIDSGEFNVVAIDSFGSVLSREEQDKPLTKEARVSGAAKLNTQLMRKMTAALAPGPDGMPNLTCVIGLNQVRANIGAQKFDRKTNEGGAWSLKHGRFVTIELAIIAAVKAGSEKAKKKIGKVVKWEVTKQKAGGHEGHEGQFNYILADVDFDRAELALRVGTQYGVIKKKGSFYSYEDVQIGQGIAAASAFLRNANLVEEIEEATLKAAGVQYIL